MTGSLPDIAASGNHSWQTVHANLPAETVAGIRQSTAMGKVSVSTDCSTDRRRTVPFFR